MNCYPSFLLCEGCGEITKVLDGKWRIVPGRKALTYEWRGRSVECPNVPS